MKFFSYELTPNNKIKLQILGIKIKISCGKNRFDVFKKVCFINYAKLSSALNFGLKTRKYKLIIPMGKDCEPATNYKYFHNTMMDATVYNWSAYRDKSAYLDGIKHPEKIFSGEVDFFDEQNMWRCMVCTNIFHGNALPEELMDKNGNIIPEKKEQEWGAVQKKIKYLIEKNKRYYADTDKKLFMFTFKIEDIQKDIEILKEMYEYFKACNENFDMLVITKIDSYTEELKDFEKEYKNIYFRFIPYFREIMPDSICYTYEYFKAWANIFKEFNYIKKPKKTNKKLKSEY